MKRPPSLHYVQDLWEDEEQYPEDEDEEQVEQLDSEPDSEVE